MPDSRINNCQFVNYQLSIDNWRWLATQQLRTIYHTTTHGRSNRFYSLNKQLVRRRWLKARRLVAQGKE